jgi:hypothetical protein
MCDKSSSDSEPAFPACPGTSDPHFTGRSTLVTTSVADCVIVADNDKIVSDPLYMCVLNTCVFKSVFCQSLTHHIRPGRIHRMRLVPMRCSNRPTLQKQVWEAIACAWPCTHC